MGIFNFNDFERAGKETTPQFAAAAAKEAELENIAKARANSLRSQNIMGAASLYNTGMSAADKSPISDWIGSKFPAKAGADVGADAGAELAADVAADVGADVAADVGADVAVDQALMSNPVTPTTVNTVSPAAVNTGGLTTGANTGALTTGANTGALTTGANTGALTGATTTAGGTGAMASMGAMMPYVALALAADQGLNDGKATEHIGGMVSDLGDPGEWDNLFEDYMMGTIGKGWLWS